MGQPTLSLSFSSPYQFSNPPSSLNYGISIPSSLVEKPETETKVESPAQGILDSVERLSWIQRLFTSSVCIQRDDGQKVHVSFQSLLKKALSVDGQQADRPLSTSMQKRFIETLDPIEGLPLTEEKVAQFFQDFRTKDMLAVLKDGSKEAIEKQSKQQLDEMRTRHLKVLKLDREAIERELKPGDVLFYQSDESEEEIITFGQHFEDLLTLSPKERQAYRFQHVALYIGDGKVAEATTANGHDVRIISVDDPAFNKDNLGKFWVARFHDPELAKEVAEVAKTVAREAPKSSDEGAPALPKSLFWSKLSHYFGGEKYHGYGYIQAGRSVWHPANFGPFARYRYLKQYSDDHNGEIPRDFFKKKHFFCSYFGSYCYQTAESRRIMPQILGENDRPKKGVTFFGTGILRGLWARTRSLWHWSKMSKEVQLKFDAKRMTPYDFRNYVQRNPHQFKDMFLITA